MKVGLSVRKFCKVNKDYLFLGTSESSSYNQKEKWVGVHLNGEKIYGSSLKEIRHIIDYPGLYKK